MLGAASGLVRRDVRGGRLGPCRPSSTWVNRAAEAAFAPLRGHLAVLVLVLGVADATASLFDVVVDHRHDGVISDTALARTVVVHHVAGPKPALLHALPRKPKSSDHCAGGKTGTAHVVPSAIRARNLEFG